MTTTDEKKIVSYLKKTVTCPQAIYLYGSVVSDDFSERSDLDIAVKSGSSIGKIRRWELQEELASQLGRDVDLLDMDQASLVMKYEVLTKGKRIFCSDIEEIESFETLIYSQYLDFNEIRKPIIEAVIKRGSAYGNR